MAINLELSTATVTGKFTPRKKTGCIYATARYDNGSEQIAIDVYSGHGETYKKRDKALINITFLDGKTWSGDFDELKKRLMKVN